MSISGNLQKVLAELPTDVRLVAVSKFHPNEAIEEAYRAGQRVFGESRAQELKAKHETLPQDIEWHFIGSLQTNKIKYIIPYVALIHAIDSWRLLEEVNKYTAKANRIVDCLLQLHIAQEETKSGFSFQECRNMLDNGDWKSLSNIRIRGLMGMATFTDSHEQVATEFRSLSEFYNEVKNNYFANQPTFNELSMGMSDDYPIAIEQGSTMVRIGSKIFGNREY
ncbi:YggS family pyridoxal phosphate-dependent enzyme [Bacteroides sp. 519]|uniref:YggS family pyridoxal phosphate-dependent enzyme n=1 Tax=Bacteroides sp. 519 TaxID=2302937 RepID=UPI0013D0AD3B|nr:YggS family pyridoxal phosphate-dependent enzyme [Bacteroides sp. 519]NDV56987.1 YggS family pyridoxal phosphate-dependent enzyme [Bacteroides sp. 519]